jgi:uncharacterized protein (DUF3084 family)
MKRNNLYQEFEDEMEFIEDEKFKEDTDAAVEDLSATEVVTVNALQRQKSQLTIQKTKLQNQLKTVEENINKLDAQIARMQST